MVVAAGFALAMSLRYQPALAALVPRPAAWALLVAIWAGLLTPPLMIVLPPLRERLRSRT
jgi:hypothetical protein